MRGIPTAPTPSPRLGDPGTEALRATPRTWDFCQVHTLATLPRVLFVKRTPGGQAWAAPGHFSSFPGFSLPDCGESHRSPKNRVTDHRSPDQQKEVNCGNSTIHKVKVNKNGVTHVKPETDDITYIKLSACQKMLLIRLNRHPWAAFAAR